MAGSANPSGGKLRRALRCHGVGLLAVFAVLCSAVFLAAPLIGRRYVAAAELPVTVRAFDGLPALGTVADEALRAVAPHAGATGVAIVEKGGGKELAGYRLTSSADTWEAAVAHVQAIADELTLALRHRAEEMAAGQQMDLEKEADRLAAREETLTQAVEQFRLAHRGILPDDPNSVLGQFEKLSAKIDDREQRDQVVTEQIQGLAAYERNPGPAAPAASAGSAARGDGDPEVLALTAQMQLLNDQVDDQLHNKHRTEQHPYVIDLRAQQAALQTKLDAAKARAAAGGAPPAEARAALPAGDSASPMAQAVALQTQSLRAEQEGLEAELKALKAQRDQTQKQVDGLLPLRRDYEGLTGKLTEVQKERAEVAGRAERFKEASAAGFVEVSPVAWMSDSTLPAFPRLGWVYGVGVIFAGLVTAGVAVLLGRLDRAMHSAGEAEAALEVPIAGTVMELRTRGEQRRRRMWRAVGQPAVVLGLAAVMAASGVLCYRHLTDAGFGRRVRAGGVIRTLSGALSASLLTNGGGRS